MSLIFIGYMLYSSKQQAEYQQYLEQVQAEEVAKAEAEHSSQAENIEDSTEIKYIIEPSEEESNEKME